MVSITTAIGASNGILVLDRLAFEEMRQVDMVLFDKAGTLTEGRFGVVSAPYRLFDFIDFHLKLGFDTGELQTLACDVIFYDRR